jgi:hypothetical protein
MTQPITTYLKHIEQNLATHRVRDVGMLNAVINSGT